MLEMLLILGLILYKLCTKHWKLNHCLDVRENSIINNNKMAVHGNSGRKHVYNDFLFSPKRQRLISLQKNLSIDCLEL